MKIDSFSLFIHKSLATQNLFHPFAPVVYLSSKFGGNDGDGKHLTRLISKYGKSKQWKEVG